MLPQGVFEAEPGSDVLPAGKTKTSDNFPN